MGIVAVLKNAAVFDGGGCFLGDGVFQEVDEFVEGVEFCQCRRGEGVGVVDHVALDDLQAAAAVAKGRHVAPGIKAFVVPGSEQVAAAAEAEGLDVVFREAGFEWREPGCSMCLAMNPDRLEGRQISASSSNRNFKGRQGSATGRTLLMSPAMVAAAAIHGKVSDVRALLQS